MSAMNDSAELEREKLWADRWEKDQPSLEASPLPLSPFYAFGSFEKKAGRDDSD